MILSVFFLRFLVYPLLPPPFCGRVNFGPPKPCRALWGGAAALASVALHFDTKFVGSQNFSWKSRSFFEIRVAPAHQLCRLQEAPCSFRMQPSCLQLEASCLQWSFFTYSCVWELSYLQLELFAYNLSFLLTVEVFSKAGYWGQSKRGRGK